MLDDLRLPGLARRVPLASEETKDIDIGRGEPRPGAIVTAPTVAKEEPLTPVGRDGRRAAAARARTLERLGGARAPACARPAIGIVHLGIGAFHRAHQAVYTAEAIERAGGDWGILGVAQRRPAAVEALGPQDGLFSVVERGPEQDEVTVFSTVRDVLLAPQDPARLAAAIASPDVHLVTLTVTERGYPRDAATGGLGVEDPEVASDLAGEPPRTAVGQLARGLALRAARGEAGPLTVVSCDNLPRNGEVLARLVRDFCARLPARAGAPALEWMERHASFPSTMVDRVVPATTAGDREEVARRLGLDDRGAVVAEPFRQWVIEDAFAGPRPAWDRAGALLVPDAGPHEAVKLRLLNGTHSMLAYVGGLAGARTVAGAWGDPAVAPAATCSAPRTSSRRCPRRPASTSPPTAPSSAAAGSTRGSPTSSSRSAPTARRSCPRASPSPPASAWAGAPPRWIALVMAAWARHLQGPRAASRSTTPAPSRAAGARAGRRPRRRGRGRAVGAGGGARGPRAAARPRRGLARAHRRGRHRRRAAGGRARLRASSRRRPRAACR